MSLKKCKECGQQVSDKADKCPGCGAPQIKQVSGLGTLIVLGLAGWFIYTLFNHSVHNAPAPAASKPSAPAAPAAPASPAKPPLELLSFNCVQDNGFAYVTGEVKNVSGEALENVQSVGEFRTSGSELVKTADALVEYNPIMPGQTSPYKVITTDNPQIKGCSISFKYLMGGKISYTKADQSSK